SLARELKTRGGIIVLGGPHPTCLPDECLGEPAVDYVVRGEGEISFLELCEAIRTHQPVDAIAGISFRRRDGIIHNPDRPFINNLDELPFPALDLFGDLGRYSHPQPLIGWRKPAVNIITSRGCPYACHFCYKGTFGISWRPRSPENVLAEWEQLVHKFGVRELSIQDDCFNMNTKRALAIGRMIRERGLALPWTFPNGIRADLVTDELVSVLKDAGMYRTAIGVESGNQNVLDDLGKKEKLEDIDTAFRILKKYRIQTIAFFVMGNPADTPQTLQESIDYAKKINPTFAQFSMATPFPGTRLYETVKSLGTLRIKGWDDYSQFDQKGYFDYPHLSGETIRSYVKKAYRQFYLSPVVLLRFFLLKDFYIKIPSYIAGLIHFLFKGK
ncbi:MAG: hypothetical protein A2096_16750, partial [Spirochaetes bacterium GWF1_41_5]